MLQSFTKYHQVINPIKFWFNARNASSKSDRNRSATWIGKHKEPLTRQQYERRRYKHRPFVLGRDNVVRRFEPVELSPEALAIRKESVEYDVKRTANGWLPVYTEYRNGRSRISTVIRRIDGNVEQLQQHLQSFIDEKRVKIRKPTNQIAVKGNVQRAVRYWLTAVGF